MTRNVCPLSCRTCYRFGNVNFKPSVLREFDAAANTPEALRREIWQPSTTHVAAVTIVIHSRQNSSRFPHVADRATEFGHACNSQVHKQRQPGPVETPTQNASFFFTSRRCTPPGFTFFIAGAMLAVGRFYILSRAQSLPPAVLLDAVQPLVGSQLLTRLSVKG